MKSVFFVFVYLVAISDVSAQISPFIKLGFGYPYINYDDISVSPNYHSLKSFPTISAEMPIPIKIGFKNKLTINPGISFFYFKEREVVGDITKGKDFLFSHHTLNSYAKVMYQQKLSRMSEAFFYAGPVGGVHLITKTKGTKVIYGLTNELSEVLVDVNENGKGFFEMFYYGLIAGFQPNAKKYNNVKVSFEVAWLPDYILLVEPNSVDYIKKGTSVPLSYTDVGLIQFSVFLGFRRD